MRLTPPALFGFLLVAVALAGSWGTAQTPANRASLGRPQASPASAPSGSPDSVPNSFSGSSATLYAQNCMVKTIQNIRVPAGAEGRITEMLAVEGANVKPGDVLALIDDTQVQLALRLRQAEEREAELNALNDINYRNAVKSEQLARAEAEAYKELRREGATPRWEMEKKILEADTAGLRIELAELQENVAKVQYIAKRTERELAEHELTRRKIVAPFAGFIENRIAQLGEWVQAGTPVLQLVQLDKLRVEGDIDALQYAGQIARGTPVKVYIYANSRRPSRGGESAVVGGENAVEIDGRIGFVSSEIDLNHRHRIWVEIENQQLGDEWVFKPGMEADIVVYPAGMVN